MMYAANGKKVESCRFAANSHDTKQINADRFATLRQI